MYRLSCTRLDRNVSPVLCWTGMYLLSCAGQECIACLVLDRNVLPVLCWTGMYRLSCAGQECIACLELYINVLPVLCWTEMYHLSCAGHEFIACLVLHPPPTPLYKTPIYIIQSILLLHPCRNYTNEWKSICSLNN